MASEFHTGSADQRRGAVSGKTEIERRELALEIDDVRLSGSLAVPPDAAGLVLFAHGSGSSRHSPRNQMVAERLNGGGFATLLFDLLDDREARDRRNVFAIEMLAGRLTAAVRRLRSDPRLSGLPVGIFGASTGAAAALCAAAEPDAEVAAIVSRGGRPDLAGDHLPYVGAPTLLIVGGDDRDVIELNRQAMRSLRCHVELLIMPGAGHLFENPGELEAVSDHALKWFAAHLGGRAGDVA